MAASVHTAGAPVPVPAASASPWGGFIGRKVIPHPRMQMCFALLCVARLDPDPSAPVLQQACVGPSSLHWGLGQGGPWAVLARPPSACHGDLPGVSGVKPCSCPAGAGP